MTEHYFETKMTPPQKTCLTSILAPIAPTQIPELKSIPQATHFTPAEFEQLCAEYDTVDSFLFALQEKASFDDIVETLHNANYSAAPNVVQQSGHSVEDTSLADLANSRSVTVDASKARLSRTASSGSAMPISVPLVRGLSTTNSAFKTSIK
jgi:hypothetical protein